MGIDFSGLPDKGPATTIDFSGLPDKRPSRIANLKDLPRTLQSIGQTGQGIVEGLVISGVGTLRGIGQAAMQGVNSGLNQVGLELPFDVSESPRSASERWSNAITRRLDENRKVTGERTPEAKNALRQIGELTDYAMKGFRSASDLPMESWNAPEWVRYPVNTTAELVGPVKVGKLVKGGVKKAIGKTRETVRSMDESLGGVLETSEPAPAPFREMQEPVRQALATDTRQQTQRVHANDQVDLPTGKLDRAVEINLPEPEVFTGIEAIKYAELSKVDPALWNATDKIFMERMGKAREASIETAKQEPGIITPEASYIGAREKIIEPEPGVSLLNRTRQALGIQDGSEIKIPPYVSPDSLLGKVRNSVGITRDNPLKTGEAKAPPEITPFYANPILPMAKASALKIKGYLDNLDIDILGKTPEETFGHAVRRTAQDKLIALRDWERQLAEKHGITIPKKESGYFTEERSHGILGDKIDTFDRDVVKPFIDSLVNVQKKHGISLDNLWEYVEAKQTPKRNQVIQDRNAERLANAKTPQEAAAIQSLGSGMTDAEAAAVLQKYAGKEKILDSLAEVAYEINRKRLDLMEQYGLESPAIIQEMRNTWGNDFISFKGKGNLRNPQAGTGTGKGMGVRNSGIKQALGRTSRAENGIIHAFEDFKDTLKRIEENEVAKRFLDLVEQYPDPSIEVNRPILDQRINPKTGQVETFNKPVWSTGEPLDPFAQNVIPVIKDGKHVFIRINDNPLLARALTASYDNPGILEKIVAAIGGLTRNIAAIYTRYSPSFALTNPIRDFFDAMQGMSVEHKTSMAAQTAKRLPESIKDIYNYNKIGKSSVYAEEFAQNGGRVGFYSGKDFKAAAKYFEKEIRRGTMPGYKGATYRTLKQVGEVLSNITDATENGTRLAVYKTLRENGYSVEDAVSYAKNVTVNFNRRGEMKWINQLYMFSNPAIQGLQRFGKLVTTKRGQAVMGTLTGIALALNEYNRYVAGEDEGGTNNFDKISNTEKSRAIIIMDPFGSGQPFLKIPLGFQQRLPFAMATGLSDMMHEAKPQSKIAMNIIDSALDAFNPIGGSQLATSWMPTLGKPFVELYANKNWQGNPIKPEQMPWDIRPESQMAFSGVSVPSKIIAEQLNKRTGGDELTPGAVDISPEAIDHVAQFFTGSLGKDVYKIMDLGMRYFDDMRPYSEVKAKDIPIAGRFTGANTEFYTAQKFREVSTEAQRAYQKAKTWADQDDPRFIPFMDQNVKLVGLGEELGSLQKEISSLTSDIRKVREAKDIPAKDKLALIEEMKQQKETLMMQFIRAHREAVK